MYTVKDILKRLNDGEDSATIAQEMADNLNEALAAQKAQAEAAEAERRKKEDMDRERTFACAEVADQLNRIIAKYYTYEAHVTAQDIIDMLDNIDIIYEFAAPLLGLFDHNDTEIHKDGTDRNPDDIIADFIKDIGL